MISNRQMYQVSGVKRDVLAHSHGGLTHSHAHGDLEHEHVIDENATPLEELLVMMKYLVSHNDAHAQEVAELARELMAAGKDVVFDVDVKGGINIKKYYGEAALSVFIQPPSVEALRERLIGRNTDEMGQIEQRLAKAEYEMSFASQFDRILVNDNLEVAKQEAVALLNDFLAEPEKIG